MRISIDAVVRLSIVDNITLPAPEIDEDFGERAPQIRRLRPEREDVVRGFDTMHYRQRPAILIFDLLDIEPDVVEPDGIDLAHRPSERQIVQPAARNISLTQHQRNVFF